MISGAKPICVPWGCNGMFAIDAALLEACKVDVMQDPCVCLQGWLACLQLELKLKWLPRSCGNSSSSGSKHRSCFKRQVGMQPASVVPADVLVRV